MLLNKNASTPKRKLDHREEQTKEQGTPKHDREKNPSFSSGSSTELESFYEYDPDDPVTPQTLPCYKNGIHYTPRGLVRKFRKKRKLNYEDEQLETSPLPKICGNRSIYD